MLIQRLCGGLFRACDELRDALRASDIAVKDSHASSRAQPGLARGASRAHRASPCRSMPAGCARMERPMKLHGGCAAVEAVLL